MFHLPTAEDREIEAALGRADVTIMVIATVDDLKSGRGERVDGTVVALDDVIKNAARLHVAMLAGLDLGSTRSPRLALNE